MTHPDRIIQFAGDGGLLMLQPGPLAVLLCPGCGAINFRNLNCPRCRIAHQEFCPSGDACAVRQISIHATAR